MIAPSITSIATTIDHIDGTRWDGRSWDGMMMPSFFVAEVIAAHEVIEAIEVSAMGSK